MRSSIFSVPRRVARTLRFANADERPGSAATWQACRAPAGLTQRIGLTAPRRPAVDDVDAHERAGLDPARGLDPEAARARRRAHAVGAVDDLAVRQLRDGPEAAHELVAGPVRRGREQRPALLRIGAPGAEAQRVLAGALVVQDARVGGVVERQVDRAGVRDVGGEEVRDRRSSRRGRRAAAPESPRAPRRRRTRARRASRSPLAEGSVVSRAHRSSPVGASPCCTCRRLPVELEQRGAQIHAVLAQSMRPAEEEIAPAPPFERVEKPLRS